MVGVTFECDHPVEARERTIVSTSAMPEGLLSPSSMSVTKMSMRLPEAISASTVVTPDMMSTSSRDLPGYLDSMLRSTLWYSSLSSNARR